MKRHPALMADFCRMYDVCLFRFLSCRQQSPPRSQNPSLFSKNSSTRTRYLQTSPNYIKPPILILITCTSIPNLGAGLMSDPPIWHSNERSATIVAWLEESPIPTKRTRVVNHPLNPQRLPTVNEIRGHRQL